MSKSRSERATTEGGSADVVMVGLVPPPFHGQSVITKALFETDLSPLRTAIVEARFNQQIDQVSAFQFRKILELARVTIACLKTRFRSGAGVLYYTPGSAKLVPFFKDVIFLTVVRPFFRRTLLHYHSGGLPEFLRRRWWTLALGRWTYGRRAWAMALTDEVEVPDQSFGASCKVVLPNGIAGVPANAMVKAAPKEDAETYRLVFLGNLYREKGILDALDGVIEAAKRLNTGRQLVFRVAGAEPDNEVGGQIEGRLQGLPPNLQVILEGPVGAEAKWELLRWADAMVFPSFYGSENFPLVLLEAQACGLAVVATRWRGIPSIVEDGRTGQLVDVGDINGLAEAISGLAEDPALQGRMRSAARESFETRYAWPRFLQRVKACFQSAVAEGRKN